MKRQSTCYFPKKKAIVSENDFYIATCESCFSQRLIVDHAEGRCM
jgi:hypothetical protein